MGRYKEEDGRVFDSPYDGKAIGKTDNKDGAGYWVLEEETKKEIQNSPESKSLSFIQINFPNTLLPLPAIYEKPPQTTLHTR